MSAGRDGRSCEREQGRTSLMKGILRISWQPRCRLFGGRPSGRVERNMGFVDGRWEGKRGSQMDWAESSAKSLPTASSFFLSELHGRPSSPSLLFASRSLFSRCLLLLTRIRLQALGLSFSSPRWSSLPSRAHREGRVGQEREEWLLLPDPSIPTTSTGGRGRELRIWTQLWLSVSTSERLARRGGRRGDQSQVGFEGKGHVRCER